MTKDSPVAPLLFILQTVLSQTIAAGAALVTWEVTLSLPLTIVAATSCAFSVAAFLRLPPPWRLVNFVLPACITGSFIIPLPSWLFVVPLCILAMIHAPALWTRVPYYPTSRSAYPLILAELPPDSPFIFIDIGCGCGDLLVFLAKHRPNGSFHGVEIGVLPYAISKVKALVHGRGAITVRFQDLNRLSLSQYDYVYAFLSPAAMTSVWRKARLEMKPGSTFITNSFETSEQATYTVGVKDSRRSTLFVHKIESESPPSTTSTCYRR